MGEQDSHSLSLLITYAFHHSKKTDGPYPGQKFKLNSTSKSTNWPAMSFN